MKTLTEKFKEVEDIIQTKEQGAIRDFLKTNEMPKFIYEIAGYEKIRDKAVTGIRINSLKVCGKFQPSYKKRPTGKDFEEIVSYNNQYFPTKDHVMFNYTYSHGDGSRCEGADWIKDIDGKRRSFNKSDLIPELVRMKELYEPREGYIKCEYCGKQRLPKDIHQKTVISRMYTNLESGLRNYCNDSPCASYDQMAHEG